VGPGEGLLQALLGYEAQLMKVGTQATPVENLVLDGLLQLSFRHDPAVAQDPA
jgi:hypothetical protein